MNKKKKHAILFVITKQNLERIALICGENKFVYAK
jgi:hypothetical protein